MRWTFQLALYARMKADPRIVLLWGDVGAGLWKAHKLDFPGRVINVGICEQATVSMAAGMAMEGLRPIFYTITPFLIERAFEQIKLDVAQQNLPVGLVGHSNLQGGPTHRELDARALMALLPGINCYFPANKDEVSECVEVVNIDAPWFMALRE